MHISTVIASFAGLVFLESGALAEDWNGGYAGISTGYNWLDNDSTAFSILALPIVAPATDTDSGHGLSLGGVVGYRREVVSFVIGAEADADWAHTAFKRNTLSATATARAKWQGSVRAVTGISTGPTLIFATAGIGTTTVKYSAQYGVGGARFRWSDSPIGATLGGGIELALGKVHPRLEYRRISYRKATSEVGSVIFRNKVSTDSIRLTAVFPL